MPLLFILGGCILFGILIVVLGVTQGRQSAAMDGRLEAFTERSR